MKKQQLFIYQLYILFCFATLVISLSILRNNEISTKGISTKMVGHELVWDGNSLTIDDKSNAYYQNNITAKLPVDLVPLFFRPIPINEAGYELLLTVPGIGPNLASKIGITRKRLGRFEKKDDLLLVHGIGRKKMNLFKEYFSFQ